MHFLEKFVGIGITTRDRWDTLTETLSRIPEELRHCEVVAVDDGSLQCASEDLVKRFPWVRFERSERNLGYIAQRNLLAQRLTAPLYLSLDDDSYPETGDLASAVEWLNRHPDVIALAFRVREGEVIAPQELQPAQPYPVRFYIGCAHLLRRDAFLKLKGYREDLEIYCEEFEFSLRAWKTGWGVYAFPTVAIRHTASPHGRNLHRINRFLTRNDLWIAAWHYCFIYFVLSFLNGLPRQFRIAHHRQHWRSVLQGYWSALCSLPAVLRQREPLSWSQQRAWLRLAHPAELVSRVHPLQGQAH